MSFEDFLNQLIVQNVVLGVFEALHIELLVSNLDQLSDLDCTDGMSLIELLQIRDVVGSQTAA